MYKNDWGKSGEGEAGKNGNGDLYIQVEVKRHKIFERDGKHLYCEVPLNFADAALGAEIEVPTLDGKVKIKIFTAYEQVNSYDLLLSGTAVFTFASTIGLEGCILGIPTFVFK